MTDIARPVLALLILMFAGLQPLRAEEIDVREAVTPSGLTFRYLRSAVQDRVVISFAFPGGTVHDLRGGPQTSFIAANLMSQSAGGTSLGEMQETLADNRAVFSIVPDIENTVGLIAAPPANIAKIIPLVNMVLTNPDFPEEKIRQVREDFAKKMETVHKRQDTRARMAFADLLAPSHPYSANIVGDPARIRSVTREDLIQWHQDRIVRKGLEIVVVGDLDAAAMAELVDTMFAGLPERGYVPTIPELGVAPNAPDPQQVSFANSPQALIVSGGRAANAKNPESWLAMTQLNMILSAGQKSRLFRSVREETGKTYGFNSLFLPYSKSGMLAIFGFVDKSGLDKTISAIRETTMKFREEGPSESEQQDVKAFIAAHNLKVDQNHIKMAHSIRSFFIFGWSLDSVRHVKDIAQSVDLSDRKYREALIPENPVFLVVE